MMSLVDTSMAFFEARLARPARGSRARVEGAEARVRAAGGDDDVAGRHLHGVLRGELGLQRLEELRDARGGGVPGLVRVEGALHGVLHKVGCAEERLTPF